MDWLCIFLLFLFVLAVCFLFIRRAVFVLFLFVQTSERVSLWLAVLVVYVVLHPHAWETGNAFWRWQNLTTTTSERRCLFLTNLLQNKRGNICSNAPRHRHFGSYRIISQALEWSSSSDCGLLLVVCMYDASSS